MYKYLIILLCSINVSYACNDSHNNQQHEYQERTRQREQQEFAHRENNRMITEQRRLADKQRAQTACLARGNRYCN